MNPKDLLTDPDAFQSLLSLDRNTLRDLYDKVRQAAELRGTHSTTDNATHVGVRLTLGEKAFLQELAAVEKTTVSAVVRAAVRLYIKQLNPTLREIVKMKGRLQ